MAHPPLRPDAERAGPSVVRVTRPPPLLGTWTAAEPLPLLIGQAEQLLEGEQWLFRAEQITDGSAVLSVEHRGARI